jgi:hypothetical protein
LFIMAAIETSANLTSSVSKLSLKTTGETSKSFKNSTKKPTLVADSWEDEDSEGDDLGELPPSVPAAQRGTQAPPPTPISPTYNTGRFFPSAEVSGSAPFASFQDGMDGGTSAGDNKIRPDKTDTVARRMIASALGVKVPKMTEEQKAYDKAMKEKERKKRDEERESKKRREEEAVKARQAVWDD